MFFEDEKDNIKGSADISIQEDGTVTWEDVLNSDDDLVSLNTSATTSSKPKSSKINLGDELELIDNDDEEVNEQELMQILGGEQQQTTQRAQQAPQNHQAPKKEYSDDDFDIDSQLSEVLMEQNRLESEVTITPRRTETKSSVNLVPILLSVLVAVLVAYGVYYAVSNFSQNQNISNNEIAPVQTPQQEMNNINQEMLEQRKLQENIPVVNEDQAKEVQPNLQEEEERKKQEEEERKKKEEEEKAKLEAEKRRIITVIPTGRPNPFLPNAKYMTTKIPDTNVDFDSAGVPKPPETYSEKQVQTTKLMTIAVSGIMYDEIKPSAIITFDNNDYFVQKGDRLDEYKVIDITRTYVTLAYNNNVYKANIGEEFKISSNFYGSAQFMPAQQGGGRQYYSIGAQDAKVGAEQTLRYVSEEDITINTK